MCASRAKWFVVCAICFALGSVSGSMLLNGVLAETTNPASPAEPFTMDERLGANLYMQTSAEYRACCLQVYKCAEIRLDTLIHAEHPTPFRPAIVMDLDETVFDNSAFQTFLLQNSLQYSDDLWNYYEDKYPQDVALVPGAKHFIRKAESLGITINYISNRSVPYTDSTINALERLGINVTDIRARLHLRPKAGSSSKSSRRDTVAAEYNVLMYFGDNLRDFSDVFAAGKLPENAAPDDFVAEIAVRNGHVDRAASHWGIDWFVLPNAVYGEWEKLIGPKPKLVLHPTTMVPPTN